MRLSRFALLLACTVLALAAPVAGRPASLAAAVGPVIALDGAWRFALDRDRKGVEESWWRRRLAGSANLPGTLPGQGIGDPITLDTPWTGQIVDRSFFTASEYEAYRQPGRIKVPFWLQPDRYYAGAAWYQTDVDIPAGWQGRRVLLRLERPHWQTLVALDSTVVGSNDSLSTPHEYDLGTSLTPGEVYERINQSTLSYRDLSSRLKQLGMSSKRSEKDDGQGPARHSWFSGMIDNVQRFLIGSHK